jgi:hypothetical protein
LLLATCRFVADGLVEASADDGAEAGAPPARYGKVVRISSKMERPRSVP